MILTSNHEYFYINYVKLGQYLMELREQKYGKRSRCEFVRLLNKNGHYRWDQSAYRKIELGQAEITIDRLCEVCIYLDVMPTEVLRRGTYC